MAKIKVDIIIVSIRALDQTTLISILLILAGFVIPVSSSGKSILIPIVVLLIACSSHYRADLRVIFQTVWCKLAICLFLYAVIASFWSAAPWTYKIVMIDKYIKLLCLPFLVAGFGNQSVRENCLHAFLGAMLLTVFISFGKYMSWFGSPETSGKVFYNHIVTSYMMSFAAYICGWFFLNQKPRRTYKIAVYGLLFILFSLQILFLNTSRTGIVLYVCLMLLLLVQFCSIKQLCLWGLLFFVLILGSYLTSSHLRHAFHLTITEWNQYQHNQKDTSIGFRLQFHNYAKGLFEKHKVFGSGTAAYRYEYEIDKPVPGRAERVLEPHSQYWLIVSEWGILGMSLFLLFLGAILNVSLKLPHLRAVALGLIFPFIIDCGSDSVLYYSASGYFFIVFLALSLAEQYPLQKPSFHQVV